MRSRCEVDAAAGRTRGAVRPDCCRRPCMQVVSRNARRAGPGAPDNATPSQMSRGKRFGRWGRRRLPESDGLIVLCSGLLRWCDVDSARAANRRHNHTAINPEQAETFATQGRDARDPATGMPGKGGAAALAVVLRLRTATARRPRHVRGRLRTARTARWMVTVTARTARMVPGFGLIT